MSKAFEVNRCSKLTVDPHQQIPIEGGRDAKRIVVGEPQPPVRFHEIDPDQQRIVLLEACSYGVEKGRRTGRVEVADIRSEKDRQRTSVDPCRGGEKSIAV